VGFIFVFVKVGELIAYLKLRGLNSVEREELMTQEFLKQSFE
jgi:hypothetical protein